MRGAARSKGGKAIIALPSTAKKGTVSRIVAALAPGTAVTTMRADVDYVVTEHGVAHLRGKGLRERALELLGRGRPRLPRPDTRGGGRPVRAGPHPRRHHRLRGVTRRRDPCNNAS